MLCHAFSFLCDNFTHSYNWIEPVNTDKNMVPFCDTVSSLCHCDVPGVNVGCLNNRVQHPGHFDMTSVNVMTV